MAFDFWHVDAPALEAVRADVTGLQFTRFVNSLLSTEASISGLPISDVHLNLQINLHDGGADAAVDRAAARDSSGWMQCATIWQYKRSRLSDEELVEEINKPSVREYIEKGHAYRLCVCQEEAPPETVRKEGILSEAQLQIKSSTPPPRILTASSLTNWVSKFPALILTYFHLGTAGKLFDIDTWKNAITAATPTFVPMEQWTATYHDIQGYTDFQQAPPVVPFLLKGEAGIGKTRLAYESLAALPQSAGLVIYCADEQEACATYLAMRPGVRAILVADECDAGLRETLKRAVAGCQDRVRVIAINAEAPSHSGGREYFLGQLAPNDVGNVLSVNFREVPPESRRRYAELCGGFIGLAADMCRFHPQITASGDFGPVMQSVEDYYRARLPETQRKHIEAIALVSRVGFKRDQANEIEDLSRLCDLNASDVKETAGNVHDSPGFVGIGGRYLYVRPEIIARVAFGEAWHRWGRLNHDDFLASIPASLLDQFLDRVSNSAPEEVRRLIADFFRAWALKLTAGDLSDQVTVDRLCALTETRPEDFLPRLRYLVEQASIEQLRAVDGRWVGTWGPRRSLVWLCERLAAFPDYFDEAERILLRLAVGESEPTIGNNATHIWMQIFRVVLSGTSIPFNIRLTRLKEHIYSADESVSSLALKALEENLSPYGSRMGGPLVVAGRIPPDEWAPRGRETAEAFSAVLDLIREMAHSENDRLRQAALSIGIEHSYNLLVRGYLDQLKAILAPEAISDETKARVVSSVEHFVHLQAEYAQPQFKVPAAYLERVKAWGQSLELSDLRGRMLTTLGGNDWRFSGNRRQEWLAEIRTLAESFWASPAELLNQFEWLFSDNARSAGLLGEQLGLLDTKGQLLEKITGSVIQYRQSAFARGYLFGFLSHDAADLKHVNEQIDRLQESDPQLAYEVFIVGGALTLACERTFRLVKAGNLPVRHFLNLGFGGRENCLTAKSLSQILEFLIEKVGNGDLEATETAIDLIAYNCLERASGTSISLVDNELRQRVWDVVEKAAPNVGRESHWWAKIVESLAQYDVRRAANVAAQGMIGKGLNQEDDARKLLIAIAGGDSEVAMEALGKAIMDESRGWRFFVGRYDVIKELPPQTVIAWVKAYGVEAARRIARQLPSPYISEDGTPVVPPLTLYVLSTFGDDKRVFGEFAAGVHSFQSYMGDIAGQHQKEADIARKFLTYPLPKIQEWAQLEIMDAESQANYWREWEAEQDTQ